MKIITQQNNTYLLRFNKNEEVISELQQFCKRNAIFSGSFQGLGAAGEVVLSYYNLDKKIYEDTTFSEDLEIASMVGNIASMNTDLIIHTHGVFGKQNLSAIAGHIKKLIVSATCEITLIIFSEKIKRSYDEETGLNLLS